MDFSAICTDAAELLKQGKQLVFVHGGSAEANALGEALGTPPKMITSPSGYTSRYTDRKTLEIFLMAVNGKVNSLLTEQLADAGSQCVWSCAAWMADCCRPRAKIPFKVLKMASAKMIRDDYTGKIETVNSELLTDAAECWVSACDRACGCQ